MRMSAPPAPVAQGTVIIPELICRECCFISELTFLEIVIFGN